MNSYPKISIVTPSFNQGLYIERTILSVLEQKYPNLEYIVVDGGSNDNTLEILKKYNKYIVWICEPDRGMYDAINKGFQMCTGEILAWINSDDVYFNNAFHTVSRIFSQLKEVEWLTGRCGYIDKNGKIIRLARLKLYNSELLNSGFYRSPYSYVVNQNVVFWRRSLWEKSGGCNVRLKFAGDFDLWTKFAQYAKLYFVDFTFSAFRTHDNQITNNPENYSRELSKTVSPNIFTIIKILFGNQYIGFSIKENENGKFGIETHKLNPKYLRPSKIVLNIVKSITKNSIIKHL